MSARPSEIPEQQGRYRSWQPIGQDGSLFRHLLCPAHPVCSWRLKGLRSGVFVVGFHALVALIARALLPSCNPVPPLRYPVLGVWLAARLPC